MAHPLYAQHGTPYDQLPDYFVAYDLYDTQTGAFLPSKDVSDYCAVLGIACVANLTVPRTAPALLQLANEPSAYSTTSPREGVICASRSTARPPAAQSSC